MPKADIYYFFENYQKAKVAKLPPGAYDFRHLKPRELACLSVQVTLPPNGGTYKLGVWVAHGSCNRFDALVPTLHLFVQSRQLRELASKESLWEAGCKERWSNCRLRENYPTWAELYR
jgi:hypothetical protein